MIDLRRYCAARGWEASEYVDTGVSGAKDRRPALDQLMTDARRRTVDTVVVWWLDRFGRNLRHLITAIEDLNAAGVSFVSTGENIDTASPTGRLLLGIMGSFAEFERERIRERIHAGLARARRQGQKLGRNGSGSASATFSRSPGCPSERQPGCSACPPRATASGSGCSEMVPSGPLRSPSKPPSRPRLHSCLAISRLLYVDTEIKRKAAKKR